MMEPTYIFVHGAWHGAWCWRELGREFDRRGVAWRAVDLPSAQPHGDPSASLVDDVAALVACTTVDEPIVLVGHSYGGVVITEAAPQIPNLHRLCYLAALVPNVGQNTTETSRTVSVRTQLDAAIEVDGPLLRLNPEQVVGALYQECSPELQKWAAGQLSHQTLASFRSPRQASKVAVPSQYILCRHDHALDPSLQEQMSERCDTLLELESDHSPYLSHPVECADALLQ